VLGLALGNLLSKLKSDIDKPLSAILTLNTIAHTVGAIGVGAQAGKVFGENYFSIGGFELSYESIIAAGMTLAILFLSEIIPKTIGANNWKSLSGFTARSLKGLLLVLAPFVWLSNLLTRLLKKDAKKSVLSKQDFAAMVDVVSESGEIGQKEYFLIKNVLQFEELTAADVMTPRTVMRTAEENMTLRDWYANNQPLIFSRIPLYKGAPDHITGILLKDDLLQHMLDQRDDAPLSALAREAHFLPANMPLPEVFEQLHRQRSHLAIVLDDFGGVAGLLTLEDVMETMLGLEIMDETDSVGDLRQYARNKWTERAQRMGIDNPLDSAKSALATDPPKPGTKPPADEASADGSDSDSANQGRLLSTPDTPTP
jgi:CBS domain containing-hemolysin-like protein